ncbi:unnamed protein product [Caenorhabditis angaria]|uniref:SUMO-activating enzyme subunit 1 n=1 Tax=Caenorhabditis angaria TaxID=860376 RepID=A0A9P1IZ59_9PELO|nr:unnamed protein product [Caenorhabditis angaria]
MVAEASTISKDEAAVYDRQIRLWGIDAQNKLRNSSVLVVGISQLGAEFAKNITLSGLNSLTLLDGHVITKDDVGHNFLLPLTPGEDLIGKNRAEAAYPRTYTLNPNVKLTAIPNDLETELTKNGEDWLGRFSLVALIDQNYDLVVRVNAICRRLGVRFIGASVFGWVGYSFFDFNGHQFLTKVQNKDKEASSTMDLENEQGDENKKAMTMTIEEDQFEPKPYFYPAFEEAFNVDWSQKKLLRKCKRIIPSSYFLVKSILRAQKESRFTGNGEDADLRVLEEIWEEEVKNGNHLKEQQTVQPEKFDHLFNPQLTPTCAVVGGLMGQEAIKALSEGKNPLRNIFIYSALDTTGIMCDFPPQ